MQERGFSVLKRSTYHWFLSYTLWLSVLRRVMTLQTPLGADPRVAYTFILSDPPIVLFDPIEISPAVIPRSPYPIEPSAQMYPSFPSTYEPVLTGTNVMFHQHVNLNFHPRDLLYIQRRSPGLPQQSPRDLLGKCPVKFSSISGVIDKTASDCSAPLAALVGNVICCPQVSSLLHIFQGSYNGDSGSLVLQKKDADDCFLDIISILASRGANSSIPALCSVISSNLTGASCPVKDVTTFEKTINTSKLLEACSAVDPLKECCRPICQPAIVNAAIRLASKSILGSVHIVGRPMEMDMLSDCKGVVYAWLSRRLSSDVANTAFRILSGCKVNKVCPLEFKDPLSVITACSDLASPNPSCCSLLNTYIASIQKQMLITNRQAINCATLFGSMLQKGGVMTNIYELCDVDLKDFSLQAYGQQGCLLRSLPADVIFDNSTGVSFTCDLSDNIAAPWPSSSSLSSLSLCAPEMSLPALPTSETSGVPGDRGNGAEFLVPIFSFLIFNILF